MQATAAKACMVGSSSAEKQPVSIVRACMIGSAANDKTCMHLLQTKFNLIVVTSTNGNEYRHTDDTVFVLDNFECAEMRALQSHYRCISPLGIRYLARKDSVNPVIRIKATRPVYCFSFTNMGFALHGFMNNETRRAVDLIHYMNGHVKRKFAPELRLIAKDTRSETYRLAVSLGQRVLTMRWLEECWNRRDNMEFRGTDPIMMEEYRLKCFGGLCLIFLGFNETDMAELHQKTLENGGVVVAKLEDATHIVISTDESERTSRAELQQRGASADAHFVTAQWFWKSIYLEFCNTEELFQAFSNDLRGQRPQRRARKSLMSPADEIRKRQRKSQSRSNLENSNASSIPDHFYSNESLDSAILPQPKKNERRHQVCMEMLDTEENYCHSLELMVKLFKDPLEELIHNETDEHHRQQAILSKQEISTIFGKIQPIIDVHRNIKNSLQNLMVNWNSSPDDVKIGYVWAVHGPDLLRVYPGFVNLYDKARETLERCLAEVPKFHTFVKLAESDPQCRKLTLKDMLIKPVQRLPSVLLLLNEILKRTERNNKDFECLKKAISEIEAVLTQTNQKRKQTDTYKDFFAVCSQIEGFPVPLISASRFFYKSVEVVVLNGDGLFGEYKGRVLTVFMFNDMVAFTKNRTGVGSNPNMSQSFYGSTRSTLTRNMSFLHPKIREKKKYKQLSMHRISDFRLIRYDYGNEVVIIKVRAEDGDFLFIAQPAGETPFKELVEFLKMLCDLSTKFSGKETIMEELTDELMEEMKRNASEDYYVINRAVENLSGGPSVRRRHTLRRTLSNVSLGISNGLQRFASRAHLSFINESSL